MMALARWGGGGGGGGSGGAERLSCFHSHREGRVVDGGEQEQVVEEEEIGEASQVLRERYVGIFFSVSATWEI